MDIDLNKIAIIFNVSLPKTQNSLKNKTQSLICLMKSKIKLKINKWLSSRCTHTGIYYIQPKLNKKNLLEIS